MKPIIDSSLKASGKISIDGLQIRVALLCGIVAMLDGFDTQAVAFVAPVLGESWKVEPDVLGLVFSAGLIGIMAGQIVLGPLSDRIGRRPVIVLCTLIFGAGSFATLLATDWQTLLVIRFLTGIGLGGATANVIALTAEYSPPRVRATMVTTMFAGFPLGAAIGGYVSSLLIPAYGWHSVFILGGVMPAVLLPLLIFALPESPHLLSRWGKLTDRLAKYLGPPKPEGAGSKAESPLDLFRQGRAPMTLLLWFAYFNSLLIIYFMMSWMPAISRKLGLPIDTAIVSAVFLNLGGAIGGIVLGGLSDRFGAFRVLAVGYALAGVSLVAIGFAGRDPNALMPLVFLAGLCAIGGQTAMNAAATHLYPVAIRGSGLGAALAIGRIGSIIGPTVGGVLLASGWGLTELFAIVAAPAALAVVIVLILSVIAKEADD